MSNGRPSPDRSWEGRVAIHAGTEGFAYVPGEVLVLDRFDEALERARELFPSDEQIRIERLELQRRLLARLVAVPDVPAVVRHLRSFAIRAQPNHVFLAHCGSGCCCGPHPAVRGACGGPGADPVHGSPVYASPVYASPVYASPVYASPVYASPVYASPVYASPVYASPVYASPVYASTYVTTGFRRSSARPVTADEAAAVQARLDHIDGTKEAVLPDVVVLDTGLATDPALAPQALVDLGQLVLAQDGVLPVADVPDVNPADLLLDPAAGHGTFIAGLVEQVAPGATVELWRVLHPQGDGTEVDIAILIDGLPDRRGDGGAVLNLSFGGYVMDQAEVLATAIRLAQAKGYVVVASAGNDGVCRPTYPAALPDVVSVGAIGPGGPAPFSNYGPWVRACAPGVDLVSTFFRDFDGQETSTSPHDPDPDHFQSWARWSGTSFAAPIVAGALAQHARTFGVPVADAVTRVIDDPALLRIADLGTVVNLV